MINKYASQYSIDNSLLVIDLKPLQDAELAKPKITYDPNVAAS